MVDGFTHSFKSLPYTDSEAQEYARIRADLERRGERIGDFDLQIAAIAITNQLTLVTHNTGEFSRIPQLAIEDWEVP